MVLTHDFSAKFQSTLPLRGATCSNGCPATIPPDFNPRSPYGERHIDIVTRMKEECISIHAPLTGSDQQRVYPHRPEKNISIHAPLTGSDCKGNGSGIITTNFNPRSPYGERHAAFVDFVRRAKFQSTLPLRGATICLGGRNPGIPISIHAPLTGSDPLTVPCQAATADFNPRSPYGERLPVPFRPGHSRRISIHAPLTGSDRKHDRQRAGPMYFNPRSPYGERHDRKPKTLSELEFQSTLPLRGATRQSVEYRCRGRISIHAPLTGSDLAHAIGELKVANFNPRSPYGERLAACLIYSVA